MKTDETIKQLQAAKENTSDPEIKKELDFKIKALQQNKTVEK